MGVPKRFTKWVLLLVAVPASLLALAAYFVSGNRPNITRNYTAELNAPILAIPEDQRAWPIYRDCLFATAEGEPQHWQEHNHEFERLVHLKEIADYLNRQEPTLRRVRSAAKLPSLGEVLADERSPEDHRLHRRRSTMQPSGPLPAATPPSENPPLHFLVLTASQETADLTYVLGGHALVAAERGDLDAAIDDLIAMIGIARQLRENKFELSDLISLSRYSVALRTWGLLLERMPERFSAEQLLRLEKAARSFGDGTIAIQMAGERMMYADAVQRFFSDDGRGDGHGCYANILDFAEQVSFEQYLKSLLQPPPASRAWSRRRNVEEGERIFKRIEAELAKPFWQCDCDAYRRELDRLKQDPSLGFVAQMLVGLLPHAHKAQQDAVQQRDALLIASALVRYRLDRKAWPERLEALVPRYIAEIPPDQFTGKPLSYVLVAGAPRIYSVGFDKHDDGGTAAEITDDFGPETEKRPWYLSFTNVPEETKGDLILWPVGPKVIPLDPTSPEPTSPEPTSPESESPTESLDE